MIGDASAAASTDFKPVRALTSPEARLVACWRWTSVRGLRDGLIRRASAPYGIRHSCLHLNAWTEEVHSAERATLEGFSSAPLSFVAPSPSFTAHSPPRWPPHPLPPMFPLCTQLFLTLSRCTGSARPTSKPSCSASPRSFALVSRKVAWRFLGFALMLYSLTGLWGALANLGAGESTEFRSLEPLTDLGSTFLHLHRWPRYS